MKNKLKLILLGLLGMIAVASSGATAVEANFRNPLRSAYPQIWCHWNGCGVTREAITKDMEAVSAAGFRTIIIIVPSMMSSPIKVEMMSDEFLSIFDFALSEAKRFGLTVGVHNCPGWSSSGGPWITPENSMKIVVSSVKDIAPGASAGQLPMPRVNCGFYREIATLAFPIDPVPTAKCSVAIPHRIPLASDPKDGYSVEWNFEREFLPTAATLAFSQRHINTRAIVDGGTDGATWTELGRVEHHYIMNPPNAPKTLTLNAKRPVKRIRIRFFANEVPEWQGGKLKDIDLTSVVFDTAPMFAAADIRTSASGCDVRYVAPKVANGKGIAAKDVLDLSSKLDAKGNLNWMAPAIDGGKVWRLLRLGYTSSGKCCAPATIEGLECDKLSKKGIEAHWRGMPAKLAALPHAKGVLDFMYIDSWEVGGQNWTEGFAEIFRENRGYALAPYLPLFAGYVINDATKTAKALYDIQRVVSDLICENYYGRYAELCREAGIRASAQTYGGPFDMMKAGAKMDEPEGEFWYVEDPSQSECAGSPLLAASVSHIFGRPIASTESFTSNEKPGRWQATLASLRVLGDYRWAQGVNRLTFHSYLHQPWDVKPGLSLGRHGSQINRYTTWWPELSALTDYVKRGQSLLQTGAPDVDVLVFRGEARSLYGNDFRKALNTGYTYDICETFGLGQMENCGGGIRAKGTACEYSLLYVGENAYLTVDELKKIAALAKGGAKIAGVRPKGTPTLVDDEDEWQRLVKEIWDGGLVMNEGDLLQAIVKAGVKPCYDKVGQLTVYRRKLTTASVPQQGVGRVFFVVNKKDKPFRGKVKFEAVGEGQIFDAVTGKITPFAGELELPARGSVFVVYGGAGVAVTCDHVDRASSPCQTASVPQQNVDRVSSPCQTASVPHQNVDRASSPCQTASLPHLNVDRASSPCQTASVPQQNVDRDWTIVRFDGNDAPSAPLAMPTLKSWTEFSDPKLKYFAGHALYEKVLELSNTPPTTLTLDLGTVHDLANIYVDGKRVTTLWCEPYRCKLTVPANARSIRLGVEVVNTWPNRLIGDAIIRKEKGKEKSGKCGFPLWVLNREPRGENGVTTWSNFHWAFTAEDPLRPAGLLGPVKITMD